MTTLGDSVPGSLHEAVITAGPPEVTFKVAGEIHLNRALAIRDLFLTIDAGGRGMTKKPGARGFSFARASSVAVKIIAPEQAR